MSGPTPDDGPVAEPVPRAVRLAAGLAALEGLGVLAAAVALAVATARQRPDSYARALFGVVLAICAGALLLRLARAMAQLAGWTRAPVIVLQLLLFPVGYSLAFQVGQPWYGVPIVVACVGELSLLFSPRARLAFLGR